MNYGAQFHFKMGCEVTAGVCVCVGGGVTAGRGEVTARRGKGF